MDKEIKLAIAQIEVVPGHPDKNVEKILKETESAKKHNIDLILFPEMAVSGYMLGDEWENDRFIDDLMVCNQKILEASSDIAIVWGNVHAEFDKKGEDGRTRKYNAAMVAQNGKWVGNGVFEGHTYKTLMPKYREFDDERHFYSMIKLAMEQGKDLNELLKPFPIEIEGKKVMIGAILCEDMWCEDYFANPTKTLVSNGAEMVVNLSCSPWTWRKNDKRHRVVKSLLTENKIPFVYNNNVGIQNNGKNIFLFDGGSTIYNSDGSLMLLTKPYEEKTVFASITGKKELEITAIPTSEKKDTEELYQGLVYGIRKFFEEIGNKKVVIGLSGGIDSAVSVCLLTEALGTNNVVAVNMPSKFNSELTKSTAKQLADNLGINYKIIPIQDGVDKTVEDLNRAGFEVTGLMLENIQARDRSSRVLAAVAASLGGNFINNGNKTEIAFGYTTLYGDVAGAIAPLADLYKHEVYQLAEYINKNYGKEVIPRKIIEIVPSAELSADQDVTKGKGDPMFYPYHDKLVRAFVEFRKDPEDILTWYKEGQLESELKIETGLIWKYFSTPVEFITDLEHKWKLFKKNYFKRIQTPPIIAVSRRAFGYDLRESQNGIYFTQKYKEIKAELLGK
ncbi:MAG: NAD(+) synthase [Candidatus Shapirobacteria bacterium]|nr:NAD(+) synthase [Candidatus Shapirobacteria bacterium]